MSADSKLTDHQWHTEEYYTHYIYYKEGTASITTKLIRETPDVSQSYCRPGGYKYGCQTAAEISSVLLHLKQKHFVKY